MLILQLFFLLPKVLLGRRLPLLSGATKGVKTSYVSARSSSSTEPIEIDDDDDILVASITGFPPCLVETLTRCAKSLPLKASSNLTIDTGLLELRRLVIR